MEEKVNFKAYNVEKGGLKLNHFFNNQKFISMCIMYASQTQEIQIHARLVPCGSQDWNNKRQEVDTILVNGNIALRMTHQGWKNKVYDVGNSSS